MSEQSEPSASETQKNNAPIGVIATLFLFGFLPFGWLGLVFLVKARVFTVILFWTVFLASIAFTIILTRFALRSQDDKKTVAGIYSVLFGCLQILFLGSVYIMTNMFYEGSFLLLVALPALYGFPVIGLILGLIGFKGKWGKAGLLLVVVQFVLLVISPI